MRRSRTVLTASALALPLTLTACAEDGGGTGGGGTSVEYGASKEEYRAALADGRLDVGSILPMLEPSEFPANNVFWDASFLRKQTPVEGILQWHGAMLEVAAKTDSLYGEYADHGIQILLPAYHSGSFVFACAGDDRSPKALSGGVAASQSRTQSRQAEAIGLSPASVTYAEMYESLERGVVDCEVTTLTVAVLDEAAESDVLSDPQGFVSTLSTADEEWLEAVQQVGIKDVDLTYADFRDWWEMNGDSFDLQPYFDKL